MNFKYKLSRRLAASHGIALLAPIVILAACQGEIPSSPADDLELIISPEVVTIGPLQQVSFAVSAVTANGDTTMTRHRNTLGLSYAEVGAGPDYEWAVSGGIISADGRYAAGAEPGEFLVIVTSWGGAADTARVIIAGAPILSQIVLVPPSAILKPGDVLSFSAFGRMSNGDSVAVGVGFEATGGTISAAGVYTAGQAPETSFVIATDSISGLADSSEVVVNAVQPTLISLTLAPAAAVLFTGASQQFTANGTFSNGDQLPISAIYAQSGGAITSDGLYTAGDQAGVYYVTATDTTGSLTDTAAVTIRDRPVASIEIEPSRVSLQLNETVQLRAIFRDSSGAILHGRDVAWASADPACAPVSQDGVVSAVAPGSLVIQAQSDGVTGTAEVTVESSPEPSVARVDVTPAAPTLTVGQDVQLQATARDSAGAVLSGKSVTWTSANAAIATVASDGLVTGVAPGAVAISATVDDTPGAANVTVLAASEPRITSVDVTPSTATLTVGASLQLGATPRGSNGTAIEGRAVAWKSSNPGIATVSSTGLVWGILPGTVSVTATADSVTGSAGLTIQAPQTAGAGFYVAPTGSPSGNGSAASPWDLQTALNHPAAVTAGDTIWVRGGTYGARTHYTSRLTGTSGNNIIVRTYPGEWATINGQLGIVGPYTTFWGLEVTIVGESSPIQAVNVRARGTKLINLIVHNQPHGIGIWQEATNSEAYGCISYNNGWLGANQGHNLYVDGTGHRIAGNMIFHAYGYGYHGWFTAAAGQNYDDITVTDNILWNNTKVNNLSYQLADLMVDGVYGPASGVVVRQNYIYRSGAGEQSLWLGFYGNHADLTFTDNYYVGSVLWGTWASIVNTRNTQIDQTQPPTTNKVVIIPNEYEAKRANIAIYNWERAATVAVDLSAVLNVGDTFTIWHVYDYVQRRPALVTGTYSGGTVSVPMTVVAPPLPAGRSGVTPPTIGPEFGAFIVQGR